VDDLEAQLRRLLDERAIREVLATYCRAVDRLDIDLLREVYHPDAVDTGRPKGRDGYATLEEFFAFVAAGPDRGIEATPIVLGQTLFEFDGDVALTETSFHGYHRRRVDGSITQAGLVGRYLDRFERRDGTWRIAHRRVVMDWAQEFPIAAGSQVHLDTAGARSREDPLYQFLAPPR
jgi:ketosteroid isomerase-like protein